MARLTRSDIEHKLLSGDTISWFDANNAKCELILDSPMDRRLFAFILSGGVRTPTGLPPEFINGLSSAATGENDPATEQAQTPPSEIGGTWRLHAIETEGFGGLNRWGGPSFQFSFDGESLLAEGPNGSGKSSLIGAIIWALCGERPRDQANDPAENQMPVFGTNGNPVGDWPPIACYPPTAGDLTNQPYVRAALTFCNDSNDTAIIERTLDGEAITERVDPQLAIPSALLEAGILMPARLSALRLDEKKGPLGEAVQKLTGLDDLVAIGALADGLCHKSREYLSFNKKELSTAKSDFDKALKLARSRLAPVDLVIPVFIPLDTNDDQGEMAKWGQELKDKAADLTKVISDDLGKNLDLTSPKIQHDVIAAIGAAKNELETGLSGLAAWKKLETIGQALGDETRQSIATAIERARHAGSEAELILKKRAEDSRYQLKAIASQWHENHQTGAIDNCPLCEQEIKSIPTLRDELETMRSAGDAAARTFDDNLQNILSDLSASLPTSLRQYELSVLDLDPRDRLISEIKETFISKERYSKWLTRFATIVESALPDAPRSKLKSARVKSDTSRLQKLNKKISVLERMLDLAGWFAKNETLWQQWWGTLAQADATNGFSEQVQRTIEPREQANPENLTTHIDRLSKALAEAEPYREAANAMQTAWEEGLIAAKIERELNHRQGIATCLSPLKQLGSLAQTIARETIEGLSDRMSELLEKTLLTEQFQFHSTQLNTKKAVVVRGTLSDELHIDATLVANTSWLRAVLWAFIFCLRKEAVEQIGSDPFPLFVFDDPQATFDGAHRHRWAQYISSLQNSPSKAQIILTTHDEMFLQSIRISGISGREAMIAPICSPLNHVGIFEGASLSRAWTSAKLANTDSDGHDYIAKVRVYVEGLLRLMLRGEDPNVLSVTNGFVVGESREKISQLTMKKIAPWDRSAFTNLVKALNQNLSPIKHMELSHHSSGSTLGMAQAIDVEEHWRKQLGPKLTTAFRLAREYHHLHGGLAALYAPQPTAVLPEGYKTEVRAIPLARHGRAAALSDGRIADGRLDIDEFQNSENNRITLAQHSAFRLIAPTLEPVASQGDILLIKETAEPEPRSLVIALNDDHLLARRFELATNHSDVAVLTAQSINPHQIAAPVIGHKGTFNLHKIVGVLYDEYNPIAGDSTLSEIAGCGGTATINALTTDLLGLVEVSGQSAEPYALDGQHLIIKNEITVDTVLASLAGKAIIAADSQGNTYFKRLQLPECGSIVLESLDSGGNHDPIVLSSTDNGQNCLKRVWPVAGILFELP